MSNGVAFETAEMFRAENVFTNPDTYRGFDLTVDQKRIVVCIDPRDEDQTLPQSTLSPASAKPSRQSHPKQRLPIAMQTGGGASGKGVDASLALTAFEGGDKVITFEEGLVYDNELQRSTVAGGHVGCRFNIGIVDIVREMIEPSDITNDTFRGLASRYEFKDGGIYQARDKIRAAGGLVLATLGDLTTEGILEFVSDLYPYHQNVVSMKGDNRAGFYIFNHHPYIGLDRNKVHRGNSPLVVQAYHDSVRATIDSLLGTVGMPNEVKALRLASLLSRIAATRTVLCKDTPDMRYLHVVPTKRGIQVEREYF